MNTNFSQMTICDVCRLIDYDVQKKVCNYCGMCDAWICQDDTNRWGRRVKAAAKRMLEPNYKGLPDYIQKSGYIEPQEGTKNE